MKILIILGHPSKTSLNGALADSYQEEAEAKGHEVRRINLGDLDFDPILHDGYNTIQELEPDLVAAQESMVWAEHIVLFSPMWWGAPSALLKGFIDRTILPGFGYKYHKNDPFWDKLLTGRSGHIIHTTDSPWIWAKFVIKNSDVHMLKREFLQFCGINPVKVTSINNLRGSSKEQIKNHIKNIKKTVPKLSAR